MAGKRVSIDERKVLPSAAPAPAPPALAAALAGHYAIQRESGRGGMATVYLARDLKYDRDVAVKVLDSELAHAVSAGRFLREIRRTAQLNHPHIVPMLDSGEADGIPYYVMPHMDGGTLRNRLVRETRLSVEDAVGIGGVIAGALGHAHRHGLIHRDVKPENILFSEGEPYLADFGIARATERAVDESATSRGLVPGTVAYMSPEQVSGEGAIDGRSDIFSLGCVLYEMLTGELPFSGPNAQATMMRRLIGPPRPIRELRPEVPEEVEATVMRALAIDASARFQTAAELKQELTGHSSSGAGWARRGGRLPWRQRRAIGLAAAALAGGFLLWMARAQAGNGVPGTGADTTRVVAFPLEVEGPRAGMRLDDDLLHQALSRWRGIVVADRFAVADAMRQRLPRRASNALPAMAASLGAGRYIRGRVTPLGDSAQAYAALYDVSRTDALYQASATIGADLAAAAAAYGRLVDSLLLRGAVADSAPGLPLVNVSLPALQAFGVAQAALGDWNLGAADSAFQVAIAFDPGYARADLWLAQVRAWQELPAASWATIAERASAGEAQLTAREGMLARALVRLGTGQYDEACREYQALRQRNDRDFAAWFGLGQCRWLDRTVIADSASPSGWRFRGSYHQAVLAYTRAFEILPSVHHGYERGAFDRLRRLFLISASLVWGYGTGADSAVFLARLGWALPGDSLVLVPYPWQAVFAGSASTIPAGHQRALARQRGEFRRIAAGWSTAFPRSAGAKHAVALSLELLGDRSAVDTLRAARGLTQDPDRTLELASAEARLLVKFGAPDDRQSLAAARSLADSILAVYSPSSAREADWLAPLATIVGRCVVGERLARQAAPLAAVPLTPPGLNADVQGLLLRAAMQCPDAPPSPTLTAVADAIAQQFAASPREERRRLDEMLLFRPTLLTYPPDSVVLEKLGASTGNDILRAGRSLALRDGDGVRRSLRAFSGQWPPALGPPTPDVALPAARMSAAIGDTAAAIDWLDRTLHGARSFDPLVLDDIAQSAAFVAAMMLRADIAAAVGDRETARRWGGAVSVLRANADPELQEDVARMRRYGGAR